MSWYHPSCFFWFYCITRSQKPLFLWIFQNQSHWKIFVFKWSFRLSKCEICSNIFSQYQSCFSFKPVLLDFVFIPFVTVTACSSFKWKLMDCRFALHNLKFHNYPMITTRTHDLMCLKCAHLVRHIKFLRYHDFVLETNKKQVRYCKHQN